MVSLLLKILAAFPPSWVRSIPWLPVRRLALGGLNIALKGQPREFDVMTPLGFRIVGTTRDLIQRYVYVFGVWEPDATAAIWPYLRDGSAVVDVGANIGYFSLLAATAIGRAGSVHAIEALPSTVELLRRNVARNDASTVTVHPVAASDHMGEVEMFRASAAFLGASSTTSGKISEGLVRCIRLDDLLRDIEPAAVTFLKVDVEGDEALVLRGAPRLLAGMPPGSAALVELTSSAPAASANRDAEAVVELMVSFGFAPFIIPNEYSGKRYADRRVTRPIALEGRPTSFTDVLFVKE